MIMIPIA